MTLVDLTGAFASTHGQAPVHLSRAWRRLAFLGLALVLAVLALPAKADLVFRFHNGVDEARKGVMQNVGIVWLRPGQVEAVRAEGRWFRAGATCFAGCPATLKTEYIANFEHLGTSSIQFCIWKVTYYIQENGTNWGTVYLTVKLEHQREGYTCQYGGQTTARWAPSATGEGATLDFSVRKN